MAALLPSLPRFLSHPLQTSWIDNGFVDKLANTFRMFPKTAVMVALLAVILWLGVPTMVEKAMVLLILFLTKKMHDAFNKDAAKKETHLPKSRTAQTPQCHTGEASRPTQADNGKAADLDDIHNASSVAGSFTRRLRELARAQDLEGVEQLAEEMRNAGTKQTVTCYGVIIGAFAQAGNKALTKRWLADFRDACLHSKPKTVSVNSAVKACAKIGDSSCAEEWFDLCPA